MLAHRIVWTLVLMAAVLSLVHGWRELRRLSARGWVTVTAAALCIAGNWGLFIYGVAVDRVVEIALGYYMSPLFSVLLGVLVLHERPRRGAVGGAGGGHRRGAGDQHRGRHGALDRARAWRCRSGCTGC